MVERKLTVPQGTFVLDRFPREPGAQLRAWDAGDEFVLHHLVEDDLVSAGVGTVIVNDGFGALGVALAATKPVWISDSHLAHRALIANCEQNDVVSDGFAIRSGLEDFSPGPAETGVQLAIVKVPRSLALLEDQLRRLRGMLAPGAVIIGAGMTKHIHLSTISHFEKILGPTRTTKARKKARLILSEFDSELDPGLEPAPQPFGVEGRRISALPGVFAQDRLDKGTALLITHLDAVLAGVGPDIVDLGCGSGAIGVVAGQHRSDAEVTFVDESHRAIASAEQNWESAFPGRLARFEVTDCLEGIDDASMDLVITNPPFHEGNARTDATTWRMFTGADRVLRPGGSLVVVGNRHLAHHAKLTRLFGAHEVIASDTGFVVLQADR